MKDAYEVCRYVRHYRAKNGYAPSREELGCAPDFIDQLVANGIVELCPLYAGGPPVKVVLTEKGYRMAAAERKGGRA